MSAPWRSATRANRETTLAERFTPMGSNCTLVQVSEMLSQQRVLVVDCQAAGSQLLELSWTSSDTGAARARLLKLPAGARVPPAVVRVTGITEGLCAGGVEAAEAWRELTSEAARLAPQPAPAVAHFARFERPFLERLAGGLSPLDLVCTHELSLRLVPDLPRRGLRALAGYFGHAVGPLRRGAAHVEATLVVWRHLVGLLEERGVTTWDGLKTLLAQPVERRRSRRTWPMPRATRLALPHKPGLYRMLRTNGDVLYVGKAASLHHRVNSYFRKQRGGHERTLEMLAQARGLSFEVTASPLEAALREPDEIKRHRPPYNVALTERERAVWFCSPDLSQRAPSPSATCSLGPFSSPELLEQVVAATRGAPEALGRGRWAPSRDVFTQGLELLRVRHGEVSPHLAVSGVLRLGTRLWMEGRRGREEEDDDADQTREWTPALVASALEWLAVRVALARRRARWLTRLTEASVVFSDDGVDEARLLVIDDGALTVETSVAAGTAPPLPAHHARTGLRRHEGFSVARFDRLRVLTTELKRLVAAKHAVAVCLGPHATFSSAGLDRVLGWL
ncbi:MAG: GIY-YIG nuclease family protein [Myxococcaceae bacterium]|nr:GIY-YIG nuclease family protein [Myxococcaceae bacterium]